MGFIRHRMGFLVPVLFLFCMVSDAGAVDIVTEELVLVKNGWIEYSASTNRLPQCCNVSNCHMVRISSSIMDQAKIYPKLRITMTDKDDKMSIIVSYDSKLDGLVGLVYRRSGTVHFLRPLSLEKRTESPCFVGRFADNMATFHTLSLQEKTDGVIPKMLFRSISATLTNPETCCSATNCTQVTDLNTELLKFGPEQSPDIYVPRQPLPSEDLSEVFFLTSTQPSFCETSLCEIYFYQNSDKELLKVSVTGAIITMRLETEGASPNMVLKQCRGEYVWQMEQKEETSKTKSYYGYHTAKPISFGVTAVRAAPGPSCWYPQDFCDPLHHVISYSSQAEKGRNRSDLILECYQACQGLANCIHFTYLSMRKSGTCYLLSDCKRTSDTCMKLDTCVSGPSDCTPLPDNGNCAPPPDLGDGYIKWQCIDKKTQKLGPIPLNATVSPGTICLQSCGAWRTVATPGRPQTTGYLESRCEDSGQWSETVTFNKEVALEFPSGPYPAPDAARNATVPPLSCGCEALVLDFNPNLEVGAEFSCKREVSGDGNKFTIAAGNECHLWCDGVLAISVKCSQNGWTGEPKEEGIWCYKKPLPESATDGDGDGDGQESIGGIVKESKIQDTKNAGQCATVYEHSNYKGSSLAISSGEWINSLGQGWNDKISSLTVNDGCVLRAYEHDNYSGWSKVFSTDQKIVDNNDAFSSLICHCEKGTCTSCCEEIVLTTGDSETQNSQGNRLGKYTKAGFCLNGFPVYKQEDGSEYLFRMVEPNNWIVGGTPGKDLGGIYAPDQSSCPDRIPLYSWKYYNGYSWKLDRTLKATCTGSPSSVELKGGDGYRYGNVFVKNSDGYFGPVCDDIWSSIHAGVVCRQLGFKRGQATSESKFGTVPSTFAMDNVRCTGSEIRLEDCNYVSSDFNDCHGKEGAGVICLTGRWVETSKIWTDSQCQNLENKDGLDSTQCILVCLDKVGCTAINYSGGSKDKRSTCVLRGCIRPIPNPTATVNGFYGYKSI